MIERKYGVPGFRPYRTEVMFRLDAPTPLDHVDRKTLSIAIRDQGAEGSCTGHGWARAAQGAIGGPVLSTQFLYFLGRIPIATQNQDSGAYVGDVGRGAIEHGMASEAAYPYKAGAFADYPKFEVHVDAKTREAAITMRRLSGSLQLRAALAEPKTTIVFGFSVSEYFETQEMSDAAWLPVPGDSARFIGGHCVCADGFDVRPGSATEGFVWIANSWSQSWGNRGYFRLPLRWFDDPRRLCDEVYAVSPA